jgi:hypothetical protein
MNTKRFHLGDVLSITTGKLVSPRHIEGVYDILNWMTGDNLFTHQLPRACRECQPHLLAQLPQLADVDASEVNAENHAAWLAEQVCKYGESFAVQPIPSGAHEHKDPITEAAEMMGGPDKVIAVTAPEQEDGDDVD